MVQPAHSFNTNVVPFRGRVEGTVGARPDITRHLDVLLRDGSPEDFANAFQITPTAAERSMTPDEAQEAPPDVSTAMATLRRAHKKQPLYVIEVVQSVARCGVTAGEVLVVAPSAPLRCLGLAIVALDGQQPDLRFYVGKRDGHSSRSWVFAMDNPGIGIEDDGALEAVHPVLGLLEPAMRYDDARAWTSRIAGLLKTSTSRSAALNPRWRP